MQLKSSNIARALWGAIPSVILGISLLGSQGVQAQGADTFENNGNYTSGSGSPVINATNFINDYGATFSINFTNSISQGWLNGLYSSWYYTKNFSNGVDEVGGGLMECNTGFRFDTQYPFVNGQGGAGHFQAGSFYNNGNINCGVSGNTFLFFTIGSFTIFSGNLNNAGIYVYATNIINPGTIRVGQNGLGKLIGQNVDFTRGTVVMDNTNLTTAGFSGQVGAFGLNTNGWFPASQLQPNQASSSLPYSFTLNNSLAYLNFVTNNATSNIVVRAVFISNLTSNTVPARVYFQNGLLFDGSATVEWSGSFLNSYDGTYTTNYLYLSNNYLRSVATNLTLFNNIPDNFTFQSSGVPLTAGLTETTNTGFPVGFTYNPAGGISNRYAYTLVKAISTSVDTNTAFQGLLTNLTGRVEITASNVLNLSLSTITGMNYLQLNSRNQYDNDGNSRILAPYSDSYLGATNGNLTVSNLFGSIIPSWSGTVQAWSTQWTNTDAASGYSYDYRVMLIQSSLSPFTLSQQQDFVLYSSNNAVISDALNISRTLSINATNLLITTNEVGVGAYSFQGELNLNSPALAWANCLPRLRILTNNGAIRTLSLANYGSAATPYYAFINTGIVTNGAGSTIYANDFVTSGNFSAGNGSFQLQARTVSMTNGVVSAAGIFKTTSDSLIITNTTITVGKSMTILATNLLTDGGTTNNFWSLGTSNVGSGFSAGLVMPLKPTVADLLGTTISSVAVNGTLVTHVWAGSDRGVTATGFSNNAAIGQLILDGQGNVPHTLFGIGGAAPNSAIYVDKLVLLNNATNVDGSYNLTSLNISNNLVIYYAQAIINGQTVAEKINHKNNDHLRWVSSYIGYFSGINLVYPPGVTNYVNAALAASTTIDSDGDGIVNADDPTPFLVPALLNFNFAITNLPQKSFKLAWTTIPGATNVVQYKTNLLSANWLTLTNFKTPPPYPGPATNVSVLDPINPSGTKFYRILVQPLM